MLTKPPHILMSHQPFSSSERNHAKHSKVEENLKNELVWIVEIQIQFCQSELFVLLRNMINCSDQVNADPHLKCLVTCHEWQRDC